MCEKSGWLIVRDLTEANRHDIFIFLHCYGDACLHQIYQSLLKLKRQYLHGGGCVEDLQLTFEVTLALDYSSIRMIY